MLSPTVSSSRLRGWLGFPFRKYPKYLLCSEHNDKVFKFVPFLFIVLSYAKLCRESSGKISIKQISAIPQWYDHIPDRKCKPKFPSTCNCKDQVWDQIDSRNFHEIFGRYGVAFKIWKVGVGGMSYRVYHLCRRCNFINRKIWIEAWIVLSRIDKKWLKKVNRSSKR